MRLKLKFVMAAIAAFLLTQQLSFAKPVDLPLTVTNHPGPAACVGFMEGRWVAKRPGEKIIEEWSVIQTQANYLWKREVLQHGKVISTSTMYVIGGRHGSHGLIPKAPPEEYDSYASIEPIWGRGAERSFKTVIKFANEKTFTYTQFTTDKLILDTEEFREGKPWHETVVFRKAKNTQT